VLFKSGDANQFFNAKIDVADDAFQMGVAPLLIWTGNMDVLAPTFPGNVPGKHRQRAVGMSLGFVLFLQPFGNITDLSALVVGTAPSRL